MKIGDKVKLSEKAGSNGMFTRKPPTIGEILGKARAEGCFRVKFDSMKNVCVLHYTFLVVVEPRFSSYREHE